MPTIGTRSALRHRLRRRDPDAKAGVEARPDVDGHGADLVETDPRLLHDELDRRDERLGVTPIARRLEERDHALVPADGAADLMGRRLDAEDEHQRSSAVRIAAARPAHDGPTTANAMSRASSSSST